MSLEVPAKPTEDDRRKLHGHRLKREREDRRMSQSQAASDIGVSQPLVAKAERGEGSEETFENLWSLYTIRENHPAAPKDPVRRREWVDYRNEQIKKYRPKQKIIGVGVPGSALRKVD